MTWMQIAEMILKLVGPILGELINKWLSKAVNKVATEFDKTRPVFAEGVPEDGYDKAEISSELLNAVLLDLPRRQVMRRALVRQLIEVVPLAVEDGEKKLPKADANELKALAAKVAADEGS